MIEDLPKQCRVGGGGRWRSRIPNYGVAQRNWVSCYPPEPEFPLEGSVVGGMDAKQRKRNTKSMSKTLASVPGSGDEQWRTAAAYKGRLRRDCDGRWFGRTLYLLCTQCYRFIIRRDDVPGLLPSVVRNWGLQWKYC